MAILSFSEAPGQTANLGVNEGDAQRQFTVRTNNQRESFVDIIRHPKCPKWGDQHPHSPALFATDIIPTQRKDKYFWDVVVQYSSAPEIEKKENPLQRPAEISVASNPEKALTVVDAEGEPMRNTAGELLTPQEDLGMQMILRVRKNLPPFLPSWTLNYRGAVNADPIRLLGLPFPKETLRIIALEIQFPAQMENRIKFVPLTMDIHYDPDGWFWRPLNRGFMERKVDGNGKLTKETTRIKLPPTQEYPAEEIFLDSHGRAYRGTRQGRNGQPEQYIRQYDLTPREILKLKFKRGRRLPFSALNAVLK